MPSLIFVAEPGILFNQSVLLAESVKKYTNNFFNDVFAFSPRKEHQLTEDEKAILTQLGVTVISEVLNKQYLDYPIANKILACLWAEKNLTDDLLVMVDSDTVFLQPPNTLNQEGFDVFLRPVDRPGQASLGPGSEYENYWLKAYSLCNTQITNHMVQTGVNCVPIRPYYNAGFVAYKSKLKIAQSWISNLNILRNNEHHPNNLRCLDQVALAITTSKFKINVLPNKYNYPIPLRSKMVDQNMQQLQLSDLVHIHYHRWFQKHGFFDLLKPSLLSDEKMDWLKKRLPLSPELNDHFPH